MPMQPQSFVLAAATLAILCTISGVSAAYGDKVLKALKNFEAAKSTPYVGDVYGTKYKFRSAGYETTSRAHAYNVKVEVLKWGIYEQNGLYATQVITESNPPAPAEVIQLNGYGDLTGRNANFIRINNNFELATESFSTVCDVYEQYKSAANAAGEGVLPARGNNCFGTALKNAFQDSNILTKDRDDDDHPRFYSSLSCSTPTADRRSDSQLAAKAPKPSFLSAAPARADLIVIPSDPTEQRAWFEAKKARQHCTGCGYFGTESACAAHRKFDVRCGKGKFCPRCADIFVGPDAKRQLQIHLQTCDSVEYLPMKHILPMKQTESPTCAESEYQDDAVNERNYISQLKSFYGADISEEFISAKLQQLRSRVARQDSRLSKAPNNPLIITRDFDTPPPTRPQKAQAFRQSPLEDDPQVIAPTAVTVRPNGRLAERLKADRKCELTLTAESLKRMPPAAEANERALNWLAGADYHQNLT